MNEQLTEQSGADPPTSRPAAPRVHVASAEPRIFGVVPPALALCLGVAGLILGIALLSSGSVVGGIAALLSGLILLALAIDAARRWPASALPRLFVRVSDATARRLGLARVSAGAWSEASRRMVALRRERRELHTRRKAEQSALGAAAYREDDDEMGALRQRLAELDERIERCEQEMGEVVDEARERVHRKRVEVQPTQPFAVAEAPPSDAEAETRTTPTVRRSTHSA